MPPSRKCRAVIGGMDPEESINTSSSAEDEPTVLESSNQAIEANMGGLAINEPDMGVADGEPEANNSVVPYVGNGSVSAMEGNLGQDSGPTLPFQQPLHTMCPDNDSSSISSSSSSGALEEADTPATDDYDSGNAATSQVPAPMSPSQVFYMQMKTNFSNLEFILQDFPRDEVIARDKEMEILKKVLSKRILQQKFGLIAVSGDVGVGKSSIVCRLLFTRDMLPKHRVALLNFDIPTIMDEFEARFDYAFRSLSGMAEIAARSRSELFDPNEPPLLIVSMNAGKILPLMDAERASELRVFMELALRGARVIHVVLETEDMLTALKQRILSKETLVDMEVVNIPRYTKHQLCSIVRTRLNHCSARQFAFEVFTPIVISLICGFAAKRDGSARTALNIAMWAVRESSVENEAGLVRAMMAGDYTAFRLAPINPKSLDAAIFHVTNRRFALQHLIENEDVKRLLKTASRAGAVTASAIKISQLRNC